VLQGVAVNHNVLQCVTLAVLFRVLQ